MKKKSVLKALDGRVRRAAKRRGFIARRSRNACSIDNSGGYMLVDPFTNTIVYGERFDLAPEDVIELCSSLL